MKILKIRVLDSVEAHELSIDTHGMNFLCIFGEHVNGGFISVLNWNASVEISFSSFSYSCNRLSLALDISGLVGNESLCDEVAHDIITAVFEYLGGSEHEVQF